MTDPTTHTPVEHFPDAFWVENSEWTFGRKLVVLKSEAERKLQKAIDDAQRFKAMFEREQQRAKEWEDAARLARRQRGLVRVVGDVGVVATDRNKQEETN